MGQALYRKYRSKNLDEVIGQEHITDTIRNAIKSGRISHAYLFTGPRGVGKTSVARILAHEISGLPYSNESQHMDIIEIDAASNRGIDEIRDLREKVFMAPVQGSHKVYIIDEVHMLTPQAFNALLKTLEEPPEHVVFILATTESHKVPETIISRTQRYVFRPVDEEKMIKHLRHIAKKEKIDVDDDALRLLARHGGGSFRDSISLLDQAGSRGVTINSEVARTMLGVPSDTAINQLIDAVVNKDVSSLAETLSDLQTNGFQPAAIAGALAGSLRSELLNGQSTLLIPVQLDLLKKLIDVPASAQPERYLELILLETMDIFEKPPELRTTPREAATISATVEAIDSPPVKAKPTKSTTVASEPLVTITKELDPESLVDNSTAVVSLAAELKPFDAEIWSELLQALKKQYNTLYGVARMAQPVVEEGKLVLRFKFAFHQKRMHEAKHRKIVSDILQQLTGKTITIECVFDKDSIPQPAVGLPATSKVSLNGQPAQAVNKISDIFGGGELLES